MRLRLRLRAFAGVPFLGGILALTALSPSILTAAGLGLAYVFGMVFPLLLAAALWERLGLDQRTLTRLGARRLVLGTWPIKVTDAVAGLMFLAMGMLALYLAFTGQSTYTPDFLLAFNHWASGILADVALRLQSVPLVFQGGRITAHRRRGGVVDLETPGRATRRRSAQGSRRAGGIGRRGRGRW